MTTEAPTLVVTPDEARAQADELERGAARAEALIARITAARDNSRSESASYEGEYAPKEEFPEIQSPAQQTGAGLMLHITKQRDDYRQRAAALRQAVADWEEVEAANEKALNDVEVPNLKEETRPV